MSVTPLLEVKDVSVLFGGLRAVDDVTLSAEHAQVTGLIGPNGAGKSTLLSVVSGLQRPNSGTVRMGDVLLGGLAPHARARLGMSRTFQRLELWHSMSVRRNIRTAAEFAQSWKPQLSPDEKTEALLDRLALRSVADVPTSALPSGIARVAEVARALASEPQLLLLDEPSAGLDSFEADRLTETISAVARDGTAVVLVEHHMEMVMRACAHIWVLDFGRVIASGTPADIRGSEAVQAAYLGAAHGL